MTAVISELIGSVKNQSEHTSKMDQLYSHWCQKPTSTTTTTTTTTSTTISTTTTTTTNITESEPKQTTAPVQNADSKRGLEKGRYEEVQEIVAICAPIISVSVILILLVLLSHAVCKRAGSSAPIQRVQILPVTSIPENSEKYSQKIRFPEARTVVTSEGEFCYHDGGKVKNLGTPPCVYHP